MIGTVTYEDITSATDPLYVDKTVEAAKAYYYAIAAVTEAGVGLKSDYVVATTQYTANKAIDLTPETEPTIYPHAITTTGTLVKANEIDYYKIYLKDGSNYNGDMKLAVILSAEQTDANKPYYYPQLPTLWDENNNNVSFVCEVLKDDGNPNSIINTLNTQNIANPNNRVSYGINIDNEGYYYIKVYSDNNFKNETNTEYKYQVKVIQYYGNENNIDFMTACSEDLTTIPLSITGFATKNNNKLSTMLKHQYFQFYAVKDQVVRFELALETGYNANPTKMAVYDRFGDAVPTANISGNGTATNDTTNGILDVTIPKTGYYILDTSTVTLGQYSQFDLTARTLPLTLGTTYELVGGQTYTKQGTLTKERDDIWYAFKIASLPNDDILDVDLTCPSSSASIRIYKGDATFLGWIGGNIPLGGYTNTDGEGVNTPDNRTFDFAEDDGGNPGLQENIYYYIRVRLNSYSNDASYTLTVKERDS